MNIIKNLSLILIILKISVSYANTYDNAINDSNIHTLIFKNSGKDINSKFFELNKDFITVSFDNFDNEFHYYSYKFIHCNKDWTKSTLQEGQYIDGFNTNYIENPKNSYSTLVEYINYKFTFPNQNINFLLSGNYCMEIFDENNNLVIRKRFTLFENKVDITSKPNRTTIVKDRKFKQEIDFTINTNDYIIQDIYNDLYVEIYQNEFDNNKISGLKPIFINNQSLNYDYNNGENCFDGNNEFRRLDIRNKNYRGESVKEFQRDENNIIKAIINTQLPYTYKVYNEEYDINGNFSILNDEAYNDVDVESDYLKTIISIRSKEFENKSVYIYGHFTDEDLHDKYKMIYNKNKEMYEIELLLKQGYYDYNFAVFDNINNKLDFKSIEGNHYETENNYNILVYHHDKQYNYDRVIGFTNISYDLH